MMAQPAFPPGMAPGHPGMGGPGHPMGMQHPGGHMGGHPGPGMMQGMHPGVSGPQVTQGGPMVTGMPQGPGTPAPGHMPGNSMAMAHLGPQQHMFAQQQNPQMNFTGGMPTNPQAMQQQAVMRQRMLQQMQAQQQQGMPMNMVNNPNFNQAQMAQMKMNMPLQQHMQQQMQGHPNMQFQQRQQQHQQQLMAAHAAQAQQQAMAQHRAQQMQLSRSQEQQQQQAQAQAQQQGTPQQAQQAQTTQAPQNHPTPAAQAQPQSQPTPQPQPTPSQTPVSQSKSQPPPQQAAAAAANQQTPQPQPPQNQPTPQIKQGEGDEEPQIKPDQAALMMQEIPKEQMNGQCILQLILFQDSLACPVKPQDLDWWQETIAKYFSPLAQMKMQLFNSLNASDKSFLLQFASLARFYHAHFVGGIKQILLSSYDHIQKKQATGELFVQSNTASLTYVFHNDIRVSTTGSLLALFDEFGKIVRLDIMTGGWQEYIPRPMVAGAMQASRSPTQNSKQSPKMNKNVKKLQQQGQADAPLIAPSSGVNEWGITPHIQQFLEVAEVLTSMGPLIEYFHQHPGIGAHESLQRINQENSQNMVNANANRAMQNQMARAANGQIPFPNQPGMNGPNQFASPGMAHLGLPQTQGSPHLGGPVHTPSPAQHAQGGVAMMQQMSAQGSNLSGSQGPSTNTSPNNKVKPSPRMGGKRQKAG